MPENALDPRKLEAVSPLVWIDRNQILLDGRPVDFTAHSYQIDPLMETNPRQCAMKGAQIGWTSLSMLQSIHGLIHGYYAQGVLYLFPTRERYHRFQQRPLCAPDKR